MKGVYVDDVDVVENEERRRRGDSDAGPIVTYIFTPGSRFCSAIVPHDNGSAELRSTREAHENFYLQFHCRAKPTIGR